MLTACSALALASCGGNEQQVEQPTETDPAPTIKRAVAERLAGRSDKIASLLDSGDACAAKEEADALENDFRETVSEIPPLYLEDLGSAIHELVAGIPPCEQPPPPTQTETQDGDGDD